MEKQDPYLSTKAEVGEECKVSEKREVRRKLLTADWHYGTTRYGAVDI